MTFDAAEGDDSVRVLVFRSADPDDFISHVDITRIDQYRAEEATLRNLQSDKQTIHPRDLPPDKREALIDEIFGILKDARKRP